MKVAWFTPFNVESAIGRYSKYAAQALSNYTDIAIFTFSKGELHTSEVPVIRCNMNNVYDYLKECEIVVYNIGDCADYHAEIFEVSQHCEGVLIIHDVCLFNLMVGYWIAYKHEPETLVRILKKLYGKDAKMLWQAITQPGELTKVDLRKYNMMELLGDNAYGIIVHSNYHKKYVEQFYKGDTIVLPLIYINEQLAIQGQAKDFTGYQGDKIHILTVGNVNENKRVHILIQLLGENPQLAEYFDYTIIGSTATNKTYYNYLVKLVARYNLYEQVRFLGFVEQEELIHYYLDADLMLNLRFPAYEGASASIIEQMSLGKACIVSNNGVYAELPDEAVLKIRSEDEQTELKQILYRILNEKDLLNKTGSCAKKYADEYLDCNLYARKIYEFLKGIIFQKPVFQLGDYCAEMIADMTEDTESEIINKIVKEIESLYTIQKP